MSAAECKGKDTGPVNYIDLYFALKLLEIQLKNQEALERLNLQTADDKNGEEEGEEPEPRPKLNILPEL